MAAISAGSSASRESLPWTTTLKYGGAAYGLYGLNIFGRYIGAIPKLFSKNTESEPSMTRTYPCRPSLPIRLVPLP